MAASDADNLYITMSARLLNEKLFIVARAEEEEAEKKLLRAGANRVVSPYVIGGQRMAQAVLRPNVMDFIELATRTRLPGAADRGVDDRARQPRWPARSLKDSRVRQDLGIIIVAIKKPDGRMVFNPPSEEAHAGGRPPHHARPPRPARAAGGTGARLGQERPDEGHEVDGRVHEVPGDPRPGRSARGRLDHHVMRVHQHDQRVQVPAGGAAHDAHVDAVGAPGRDPGRPELVLNREAAVAGLAVSKQLHVHRGGRTGFLDLSCARSRHERGPGRKGPIRPGTDGESRRRTS